MIEGQVSSISNFEISKYLHEFLVGIPHTWKYLWYVNFYKICGY